MNQNKKFALKINKISKSFGEKVILKDVSFSLYFGEKVALIGANGSGKSILAKIIIGQEKSDDGNIEIFKNFSISYLPQEINKNILVSRYFWKNEKEKKQLRSIASKFLTEFGFEEEILLRKISSLSGGEKTKIFLIKISLEKSEIIILDEPTNNLDSEGLEFLENIIKNSNSAFLIISHDRKFMDNTVSKVIFLDQDSKNIKIYDGRYSDFTEKKIIERKKQERDYVENQRQKGKITKEMFNQKVKTQRGANTLKFATDNRRAAIKSKFESAQNSAGRNLKRAQIKLDSFEDLENIKIKRPLKIDFSEMKKSGNKVLVLKDLKLEFGMKKKISLEIFAGDKVLISGKNGSGKTTLIKEILKYQDLADLSEKINWGINIEIGYLPQDFLQEDNIDKFFLEYFLEKSKKKESDARKILSRFSFKEEEVFSKISELSPGMRGRGRIALMLANNPNVLILDEPTNNLDLEVLEKLEEALWRYKGTIIFVSHDRYFVEKISPNKIIKL